MKRFRIVIRLGALLVIAALGLAIFSALHSNAATIRERLKVYGPAARARLAPHFKKAALQYPPAELIFVGLKSEKVLEIYARSGTTDFQFVRSYPVLAASGVAGPKLREGDRQVPEGIYQIELLNPNSSYHLSLRIGYPNEFDRQQAAKEKRTNLGGDIMIHGKAVSVGCLAIGDEAAEDLFVLAADTGLKHISVILSPRDFRTGDQLPADTQQTAWTPVLYAQIKGQLTKLQRTEQK